MVINPLDKQTADAICTIIAIGFMAEQSKIEDLYQRTEFQYEKPEDRKQHDQIKDLVARNADLHLRFECTQPQRDLPFIISKAPVNRTPEGIVTGSYNNTQGFWFVMEEAANQNGLRPRGAYIGGYADGTGFRLTGPSNLVSYMPAFRTAFNQEEMENQYYGFVNEIIKSDHCVLEAIRQAGGNPAGIIYDPDAISGNGFLPDRLVGCIHGMVHGMLRYPGPPAPPDSVHIEFALGSDTSKVASCIPCSIFMSANGRPASATHLGRGDNWNFPYPSTRYQDMEAQQDNWGKEVIKLFMIGRDLLRNVMEANPNLRGLERLDIGNNIPQLFLESLTFQDSFTTRIINTLDV